MTVGLKEFLAGKPFAYKGSEGDTIAIFKPNQGIFYMHRQDKDGDWVDASELGATRFYHNMKSTQLEIPKDLSPPKFLDRFSGMSKKDKADLQARLDEINRDERNPTLRAASENAKRRDFNQPKGVSDEEWAARNQRKAEEKEAKKKAAFERMKSQPKEKSLRAKAREGLIPIATIAKELGLADAKEARVILRAKKVIKPGHGWAGDEKWAAEIKEILSKAMKETPAKGEGKKGGSRKKLRIPPAGGDTNWALSPAEKGQWTKDANKRDAAAAAKETPEPAPKKKTVSKAAAKKLGKGVKKK